MSFKLDIHAHILPPEWPDLKKRYGYGGWLCMKNLDAKKANLMKDDGTFFRAVESNCWCPEDRILEMDRTGVNVQLISTVPVMFSYWAKPKDTLDLSRILNDHIVSVVAKYPKRFIGCATVPLQCPEFSVKELKRSICDLGLKAVVIGSHVNEWNLDCRDLDPFYKTAEDLGVPIFVHPWDMQLGGRMSKYWMPWLVGMPTETTAAICSILFGGVLERFPKLTFCFSHGAGSFPYTIGRIDHGFQVRPDLCAVENSSSPRSYLGKIFADSLVHDSDALQLLVKVLGEDRVILGSDYPFPLGEHHPGKLVEESTFLHPASKEKILGQNARDFLNIRIEDFM